MNLPRKKWLAALAAVTVASTIAFGWWAAKAISHLDRTVVERLSGRPWQLPAKIFSEPFAIYPGRHLSVPSLLERLSRLDYVPVERVRQGGEYRYDREAGKLEIHQRSFGFADRIADGVAARMAIRFGQVLSLERLDGTPLDALELEPETLAGIYEDAWQDRRVVRLAELPASLLYAVLAAEDRRFFDHSGIDTLGILRAVWTNLRSGRVVEGGSTLTQQLVKNFFLTKARTLKRKVTEAVMALLLERRFTKLEILELYLNEIYLGQRGARGIFGVWEGAKFYFGKEPRELTVAECATLAGLIKAPGRYAPTRDPDRSLRRRNRILGVLAREGRVSEDEYQAAIAEPLPSRLPTVETTEAPFFIDNVREELEGLFSADDLTSEGFRIFTTLDASLQRHAERAVKEGLARLEKEHPRLRREDGSGPLQAALLALEPRTGEIRAMVGGRAYAQSQWNRVTQARRQPGSVFKPIVFLAAFEAEERDGRDHYLTTRRLDDSPFRWSYDGRSWTPANFDGDYRGDVSLRQTLELSLNSATARLAAEIGLAPIVDIAGRLGFAGPLPLVPALILGAAAVTPLEVGQAFASIANLGFRTGIASIRRVVDHEGMPLERTSLSAEQAVSPRVAYLVTSLMQGVIERGTARSARRAGITAPVAGKTGTTDDGRDAWFVGFTPDLIAVVWVGFDEGTPAGLTGSQAALPIWIEFMKAALEERAPTPFLVPPGIETAIVDPTSGLRAIPECPNRLEEAFFQGDAPTGECPLHAARVLAVPVTADDAHPRH